MFSVRFDLAMRFDLCLYSIFWGRDRHHVSTGTVPFDWPCSLPLFPSFCVRLDSPALDEPLSSISTNVMDTGVTVSVRFLDANK